MKSYADYMDNISVGADLHDRIINQVVQNAEPHPRKAAMRYAGLAACAAAVLIVAIAIPGLINAPGAVPGGGGTGLPNGAQAGAGYDDPAGPMGELYPLIFNEGESMTQASRDWAQGSFDYDLTEEQLSAVFPGHDLMLAANAFYGPDGTLLSVTAIETMTPGRMDHPVRYAEAYVRTEIQLGEGEIIEDCIVVFEGKPQISDVGGVPVTVYMIDFGNADGAVFFQAEFVLDNVNYRVKIQDNIPDGQQRMTEIVNAIIANGAADLSVLADPVIPKLRYDSLTLEEARLDPDFGSFIPQAAPEGFVFESSYRIVDTRQNGLFTHWGKPNSYIEFAVSEATEYDRERIVSVSEREKYDMSLYTIPFADSIPGELWEYVNDPVFIADEFSLDVIKARAYRADGRRGDAPAWRMGFSVLDNDVIIRVYAKGATPEQIWEMLSR